MIIATILKNYKCYKGINVLPFSNKELNYLNIIIGNNGVGKSAVLEGLDTLFNDARWIINNTSKSKKDVQTGALFLLEKRTVDKNLDAKEKVLIKEISDFFWTFTPLSFLPFKEYELLFDIRNNHKDFKDTHYIVFVGKSNNDRYLNFLTFTKSIKSVLPKDNQYSDLTIHKLLDKILAWHAYIYIPIEASVSDFVKLQNMSMQMLMDRHIKDDLSKSLTEKRINRKKSNKTIKLSLLDLINEKLEAYVDTVEADIQNEYEGYSYRPKHNQSSKLTVNHVADTIIEAYYSKRIFKKDGKLIEDLSSGEKRIILIDIISAFIQKNNPSRELIVAIDEPESS